MTTTDETRTPTVLTAKDFEVQMDATHTYPFFEDEDAYGVYGHGHVDPATFAVAVNAYDEHMNGEPYDEEGYAATDVRHEYAQGFRCDDGDTCIDSFRSQPFEGATPVTWIQR